MWTSERVELLMKLIGEGASGGEAANALGAVTRSACIAKAKRLGLNFNSDNSSEARTTQAKKRAQTLGKPTLAKSADGFVSLPVLMREPAPAGQVAFIDAKHGQCRWFQPGHEGAFGLICARDVAPGHSYCKAHYLRSLRADERPAAAARLSIIECSGVAA